MIGLKELLKAEPDGYTLMVGNVGSVVLNYAMDTKAGFDPMKDLVPIASTAEYATTMVVNKDIPVNSVKEFIDYAKARQGALTYGSTGEGSLANLSTQLFHEADRREDGACPYKGGPLALNDLIAGHNQLIIEVSPVVNEQVLAGTIKGLAVTSPYRQPMLPNVPTFAEAGVPGVVVTGCSASTARRGCRTTCARSSAQRSSRWSRRRKSPRSSAPSALSRPTPGRQGIHRLPRAEVKRWVAFYTEVGLRK